MKLEEVALRQIRMRLTHPFETSFGVTESRHVVLVEVREGDTVGYGEVTAAEGPFFSHESYETAWHVLSDFIVPWSLGHEFASPGDFPARVDTIRGHRMARAALENALWDLEARRRGIPLWQLLGAVRSEIACGVSIGIQPTPDELLAKIEQAVRNGYRRVKVKIGPGRDRETLARIRRTWPELPLVADANSAYTLSDTPLLQSFDEFGLMMLEQPLHWEDIIDHATLQARIATPICLDESIRSSDDARKAIDIGACRIVNIKLGRVGGHTSAREVHDRCLERGVPVWCGGMLETGVGRAHNVALSGLEGFTLPGDVAASRRYWDEDIIEPEIEVTPEGTILQSMDPGIGYRVREDRIEDLTERHRRFLA
jgi:O-succinylbenzoate synthase